MLKAHPALLGIGLDESTAIVVTGDRCEVAGVGTVRFFAAPDAKPDELQTGARYDLAARRPAP